VCQNGSSLNVAAFCATSVHHTPPQMKTIHLLAGIALLCAPLAAQNTRTPLQLDPGMAKAWGPGVTSADGISVIAWNEDGTNTVWVSNSHDSSRSFTPPIQVDDSATIGAKRTYKDAIALGGGKVYLAFEDMRTGAEEVWFSTSSDAGDTWGANVMLTKGGSGNVYDVHTEAFDNFVYVLMLVDNAPNEGAWLAQSSDHGATWATTRMDSGLADVDNLDLRVFGPDVFVVWDEDTTGNNQVYCATSNDSGATWNATVQVSATGKAQAPDVFSENGDVAIGWLEDDPTLSGTFDDVVIAFSTDHGVTFGAPVQVTSHAGLFDCDNLEIYHSQFNTGTGGMMNVVYEDNSSGIDHVMCTSSDDYGVTFYRSDFGEGSYPRVMGWQNHVGVVFGSGPGYPAPENPTLAVSRNGGVDFGAPMDMSHGTSVGDIDYIELAFDPRYGNFTMAYLDDSASGVNQIYTAGRRAASVAMVPAGAGFELEFTGFGISHAGETVQGVVSLNNHHGPGGLALPYGDGRFMYLARPFYYYPSMAATLDGAGNARSAVTPLATAHHGLHVHFAAVSYGVYGGSGQFGDIAEPFEVVLP